MSLSNVTIYVCQSCGMPLENDPDNHVCDQDNVDDWIAVLNRYMEEVKKSITGEQDGR